MQVAGVSGGLEVSASSLLEPFSKDLSRHQRGVQSMVCEPVRAPSLDSLKRNCNKGLKCSCGKWSMRGVLENGTTKYVRLGCKGWTCSRCGPKKATRVRHGIIQQATKQDLRRFLTLTLDPRNCKAAESIPYIREVWRKFRVSLQRRLGKSVTFIAVIELQQSGYAHLHILIGQYVSQAWLSAAWDAVGGGRIVFIKQADIHRISAYVSKYLTKELLLAHNGGKYRRYTTSRDIKLFEKVKNSAWTVIKIPIPALARFFKLNEQQVIRADDGILESFTIFEGVTP
ncbi:MAG: hypothetical protein PHD76_05715 [Methylacidiphilales bacterium]|nr:hypothetical protein [Candidatus Methylacidiphilales bacterium]